jgi:deoxyribose-phosphate aldolase
LNGRLLEPNRRIPLNLDWIEEIRVNTSAVERRTGNYRHAPHREKRLAGSVAAARHRLHGPHHALRRRHCRAREAPLRQGAPSAAAKTSWKKLGIEELQPDRRRGLRLPPLCRDRGEGARRLGHSRSRRVHWLSCRTESPLAERVQEIRRSVEAGAQEIDIVITRAHVFNGEWNALYDEVAAFKDACGPAHMKSILGTGDLLTLRNVARASGCGHDGRVGLHQDIHRQGSVNATLPVSLVMVRAVEIMRSAPAWPSASNQQAAFKSAKQALEWLFALFD